MFSSAAGGAHWQIAIRCPSLPFPSVKVHQAAVLVRRFCFSMVAGCVDQNIKDPYGNTLHLHEVTFMLMAGGGGFPRWGGLRATHYYHMHTSRGDVCLGRVWGSCWWAADGQVCPQWLW